MMKIFQRMIALAALLLIVTTASFTAPMCALCAPASSQHKVAQAKAVHDHCGSGETNASDYAKPAISHCEHSGSVCMVASAREHQVLQAAASQTNFVPALQVATIAAEQSISAAPTRFVGMNPAPLLLTTALRV